MDHFSRDCPKPRQNRTFVRAARSAKESGSEDDREYESANENENEIENRRMSDISERDEEIIHDSDERIEIEVPVENEFYENDESEDRMFGIRTSPERPTVKRPEMEVNREVNQDFVTATIVFPLKGNETTKEVKMRKHKLIPSRKTRPRPTYSNEEKRCLATWVEIKGLRAWTLWDSGSTTTGITPAFAELAQIPVDELEDPHVLQLGTVGSRSSIKYGADIDIDVNGEKMSLYVDIANFDRYEMIIGTPFMRRNKVLLDFDKNEVIVKGKRIPAVMVSSKNPNLTTRHQRTTDKNKECLAKAETDLVNTMAATRGSSQTKSEGRAKTIEEIAEDKDRRKQTLTDEIEVILMTESEFISLSEEGEMEELKQQFKRKKEKLRQGNKPTIEKTKVEDLVTDEDEATKIPRRNRELRDRPVPPPDHRWVRDPRLPAELNEISASMWEYNWPHFAPAVDKYRQPDTNEVSKPTEFIAYMNDRPREKEKKPRQGFSLPTIDKSMEAIDKLKKQYQVCRQETKSQDER